MPRSGCSALHRVNPNLKKKKKYWEWCWELPSAGFIFHDNEGQQQENVSNLSPVILFWIEGWFLNLLVLKFWRYRSRHTTTLFVRRVGHDMTHLSWQNWFRSGHLINLTVKCDVCLKWFGKKKLKFMYRKFTKFSEDWNITLNWNILNGSFIHVKFCHILQTYIR